MTPRLWMVAALFHAVVASSTLWVAIRWKGSSATVWRRGRDLLGLAVATIVSAMTLETLLPDPRFAGIRFLAQALFGEGVLLLAWIAWSSAARRRLMAASTAGSLCVALVGVYWVAYHVTPEDLQVRRHLLDRTQGAATGVLRVLHLSDLQVCRVGAYERRVVREAQRLRPDIVLMTGDYVQTRLTDDRQEVSAALRALLVREHFGTPLGVFAVGGDVDGGNEHLFDGLGVRWLADDHAEVPLPSGKTLVIVGLTRSSSRLKGLHDPLPPVDAAPRGDLFFVMGHGPDFVAAIVGRRRIDLALAGHTHGGQVVLPFFGPPLLLTRLPRRYAAGGLTSYRGVPLHVSRGTGMERGSAPQLRFLCPPEICLIAVRY